MNDDFSGGLSRDARNYFFGQYKTNQVKGRYGAFAIAGAGEYGSSWNFAERTEAESTALAQCNAAVADGLIDLNARQRKWVEQSGQARCNIVDTRLGN